MIYLLHVPRSRLLWCGLYAPIAHNFLKSPPNKNTTTTIKQVLGVTRSEDMIWVTGFDAVRLWHEYECGRDGALELLLKYNREDVANLETIIELMHPKFVEDAFSAAGGAR